jgi:hypothetical protein
MPTILGYHRARWGPRNHMTVADRSRLVDCTTWSGDAAGTDRSLFFCALNGISAPSRASASDEILVLDERAERTPREIANEKLDVALHASRHYHHPGVKTAEPPPAAPRNRIFRGHRPKIAKSSERL